MNPTPNPEEPSKRMPKWLIQKESQKRRFRIDLPNAMHTDIASGRLTYYRFEWFFRVLLGPIQAVGLLTMKWFNRLAQGFSPGNCPK